MTETEEQTQEENQVENSQETSNLDGLTADDFKMVTLGGEEESEVEEEDSQESDDQSEETENDTDDESTDSNESEDGGTSDDESSEDTNEEEDDEDYEEEDDNDDDEIFAELTEETGVNVSSYEELQSSLKELKQLREQGASLQLSPALEAARKVEESGGNLADHFARAGMDFEKMDSKEVLRQKFFKDEAKLYSDNPKLAQMKFEKSFKNQYGNWDQFQNYSSQDDKDDFAEEVGQDSIDYDKMMLENDVSLAREELEKWKKDVTPAEPEKQIGVFSESEAKELADAYIASAQEAMQDFQATAIPMGEGLDDFALGLNDKTSPIVEQWVDDPAVFLQDIGFDGKEIDVSRLIPIMTLIAEASVGNLGGLIAKHATDSNDVETLNKRIAKPTAKTTPAIPQSRTSGDAWDKIGDAAAQARERYEG